MKQIGELLCILVAIFSIKLFSCVGSSSPPISLLGVAPQDEQYYESEAIECRDGSGGFTRAQLNDDFCDCHDGTDEPGTPACPEGKFYCRNEGHLPISLFSSRVNDGICDCCDGSDEYDGTVNCSNSCSDTTKMARESLEKEIALHREGISVRKRKMEKGKLAFAKEKNELPKLIDEEKTLTKLVKRLEVRKGRIEKAERKERERKEKLKQNEEIKNEENNTDDKKVTSEASIDTKVESLEEARQVQNTESSENTELSREELGRRVASRWTGEKTDDQAKKPDTSEEHDTAAESVQSKSNEAHAKEHEENTENDSKLTTWIIPSWWNMIQESVSDILLSFNLFQPPVNVSDGDRIRKEYDTSSMRLVDVKSKIAYLTKKLEYDFGPEYEFYSFYDRCYETKQNKYVYKVCPYSQAYQEEEDARKPTWLGSWYRFEDEYSVMMFSNGAECWNGPARSIKVNLRCGMKTELSEIGEPSRCEYEASLSTPVLCREDKLLELEREWESMKEEKSQDGNESESMTRENAQSGGEPVGPSGNIEFKQL